MYAASSGAILFDASGDPTLEFTVVDAPTNEIDGFATGDNIQIDGFIEQSGTYFNNTLVLHGTDDSGTTPETVTLDMPGLSPSNLLVQVANGWTTVSYGTCEHDIVACYCPGTLIETREGARGIEQREVVAASGALRPIKWIGRSYGGRFILGRTDILPVCIKRGALDVNVPARDLWVSPHHAMLLDGVLIEAKHSIKGSRSLRPGRWRKSSISTSSSRRMT